jgi:hypothetical protein
MNRLSPRSPLLGVLLLAFAVHPGVTQTPPALPAPITPPAVFSTTNYVEYPSLQPVTAISVMVKSEGNEIFFPFKLQVANPNWHCTDPQNYSLEVVDKNNNNAHLRWLDIAQVRLIGNGLSGTRFTTCAKIGSNLSYPNDIDLVLKSKVNTTDAIQLHAYGVDETGSKVEIFPNNCLDGNGKKLAACPTNAKLAPVSFAAASYPAFTSTPQSAAGEALNNGATRDVGQLNISFSDTQLFSKSPINLYVKSTDLFSTDAKDSKSAMSFTGGIQRGFGTNWYSPWQLQETLQGNQTAKNLSAVTSANIAVDPPWCWTAPVLNTSAILAPLPFESSVAALYTHRINQLVTKKTPLLAQDDFSLNPAFSWDTISFPWACKLLFWEKSVPATKPVPGMPATICLGTEIDLGLWYLPLDFTANKHQRVEGYGDISILVPLSDFAVAANELTYVAGGSPTKFQVRIKYSDDVNAANSYARTKGWTFGIEALK